MVTSKYDTASKLHLTFPDRDRPPDIVHSSRALIKYEQSLPPEERLKHTPYMVALVADWDQADAKRLDGESQRAEAAEAVERLDREMIEVVRTIRKIIDAAFPTNPSRAKAWGFEAKKSTKNILLPQTRKEHLNVLDKYIAKEQSRPEEERFRKPDLAAILAVRDELKASLTAYQAADTQQRNCDERCRELLFNLSEFLQAGGVEILGRVFRMKVSTQMRNWGYDVTLKRRKPTKTEETALTNGTTADSSTNGSTELNGTINGQGSVELGDGTPAFTD